MGRALGLALAFAVLGGCATTTRSTSGERAVAAVRVPRAAPRYQATSPTPVPRNTIVSDERDDVDRTDDFDLAVDGARLARAPVASRELVALGGAVPARPHVRPVSTISLSVRDPATVQDARDTLPAIERALSRCHTLVLAREPRASGELVLAFTVDADGRPIRVTANGDETLALGRACFETPATDVRFAPARIARRTITLDVVFATLP